MQQFSGLLQRYVTAAYELICCSVGLLRRDIVHHFVETFYLCGAIQTYKTNLISPIYQIIVITMLNNWSRRYSSHYIIKFVGFILIYYTINLDIVSSCMVFNYLYFQYIDLLQV